MRRPSRAVEGIGAEASDNAGAAIENAPVEGHPVGETCRDTWDNE